MNYDKLLNSILDVCEELIISGAEIARAQDSVKRMCRAYECERTDIFAITSNIQATIHAPDGEIYTQIRSVEKEDVNFNRLDELNNLSRRICREKPDPDQIEKYLDEILTKEDPPRIWNLIGSILVSGAYSVFFGHGFSDLVAAGIVGLAISISLPIVKKYQDNKLVINFLTSLIAGVVAILTVDIGIGNNVNNIMIAGIMLLIPGIALTNSIRDMFIGDIATGLLRLFDSLLIAVAIAGGFAISIIVLGGVL